MDGAGGGTVGPTIQPPRPHGEERAGFSCSVWFVFHYSRVLFGRDASLTDVFLQDFGYGRTKELWLEKIKEERSHQRKSRGLIGERAVGEASPY